MTGIDVDSDCFETPFRQVACHPTIARSHIQCNSAIEICYQRLKRAKRTPPDIPNVEVPLWAERKVQIVASPGFVAPDLLVGFDKWLYAGNLFFRHQVNNAVRFANRESTQTARATHRERFPALRTKEKTIGGSFQRAHKITIVSRNTHRVVSALETSK